MQYSYDELLKINGAYHSEHFLNQDDVDTVNRLIERIEASRQSTPQPMDGDKVICINPRLGEVSQNGYLEKRERISICVCPTVPFIRKENLHTDAGGGPWFHYRLEQFLAQAEFGGKTLASFYVWGRWGPWVNGAIYFQAKVFRWRVTNPHFQTY
jgi:hypothetical protein